MRCWLRNQLRNIAPFATLLVLVVLFWRRQPVLRDLGNLANIVQQISVTGIIATGLTFVILCAEIDLSVASVANAVGIVVAFFTLQDAASTSPTCRWPARWRSRWRSAASLVLGAITAFGVTVIGIPSFIMTLAMLQIGAGVCAMLVRGQIAYAVPGLVGTLGNGSIGPVPWIVIVAAIVLLAGHRRADLHAVRPLRVHDRRQPRGGGVFRHQHARASSPR